MADQATWARRVTEWKASGKTSVAFCEGKDFTPGGLRHMAHRLFGGGSRRRGPRVRIARVLRLRPTKEAATVVRPSMDGAAVVIELGRARVVVPTGADHTTLEMVLELLASPATGGGR